MDGCVGATYATPPVGHIPKCSSRDTPRAAFGGNVLSRAERQDTARRRALRRLTSRRPLTRQQTSTLPTRRTDRSRRRASEVNGTPWEAGPSPVGLHAATSSGAGWQSLCARPVRSSGTEPGTTERLRPAPQRRSTPPGPKRCSLFCSPCLLLCDGVRSVRPNLVPSPYSEFAAPLLGVFAAAQTPLTVRR